MATAVKAPTKLLFIEGMRGLAALYVVLGHFCSMADPRAFQGYASYAPTWLQIVMAPLWYGHLAVAAFIVLSGFCLQMSLINGKDGRIHDLKRFFVRRAWRILPPYYACLLLSLLVAAVVTPRVKGMPFEQYLPLTTENVTAHFLLIHNWSPAWMYKINGVLWSIAAEAQLYLLFPFLVALLLKVGRRGSTLIVSMVTVAALLLFPGAIKLHIWYLPLFFVGMAAAHLAFRPHLTLGTMWRASFVFGCACLLCLPFARDFKFALALQDSLVGLATASFTYLGAVRPSHFLPRFFGLRWLVGLGGFSYSLYLIHHPIQQTLFVFRPTWIEGETTSFCYLLGVGLPVILLGSALFARVFERPFTFSRVRTQIVPKPTEKVLIGLPLGLASEEPQAEMVSP